MSERVVVVVPGAEGGWIVRAFAREAIDALRAEPTDETVEGKVLVIDREVEGFRDWLERFEGDAILVGWDAPGNEELGDLPAVAFYPRPVHLVGLIRRVQTLLGGEALPATPSAESSRPPSGVHTPATIPPRTIPEGVVPLEPVSATSPTEEAEHPAPPSEAPAPTVTSPPVAQDTTLIPKDPSSPVSPAADPYAGSPHPPDPYAPDVPDFTQAPREPTVRLETDATEGAAGGEASSPVEGPVTRNESSMPPQEGEEPERALATLSPRLAQLLQEADRRLFPNESPLELTFPAGDEPPEVLVPDDLLADSATPLEPRESDPLEAFTFVGTPDLLDTSSGNVPGEVEGSVEVDVEHTPHTVVERASRPPPRSESLSSELSTSGGIGLTRSGTAPAGGALRMALDLVHRRRPCRLRLAISGGPEVELHLEGEVVLGVRGPRNRRALTALVRSGRLRISGARIQEDGEEAAAEILDDAVQRGALSAFERDRALRVAAEALVGEALLAEEVRFTTSSAEAGSAEASPVAGTLTAVAVEAARRRLDAPTVLRWLSVDPAHRLRLDRSFALRARDLGLEPEVVAAFVRSAGQPLRELLSAPPQAGVPGALFALASVDLVQLEKPAAADAATMALDADALALAIERARALAEEGTYHAILGVEPGAHPRVLELARRDRLAALQGELERLGLEALHPARAVAREAIEEAFEVLSHPRWGEMYAPVSSPVTSVPG